MTWSEPAFSYVHAVRSAVLLGGVGVITTNTSFVASKPADYLYDDRAQVVAKMGATSANQTITVDRGAGTPRPAISCIVIPAGHNLNGCSIKVDADDDVAFGSPSAILTSSAIATTGTVFYAMTSNTERYVRLTLITSGTQWELPELIYGNKITLGTEAALQEAFGGGFTHNTLSFAKQNGEFPSVQAGPNQRLFDAEWRLTRDTAATNVLALLTTVGDFRPFLYWPPFHQGATDPPYWVKATGQARVNADGNRSSGVEKFRVSLSMREWAA